MENKLKLISPEVKYEESYKAYMKELKDSGEDIIPAPLMYDYDDFPGLVKILNDEGKGIAHIKGYVPASSYWLIDENEEIVGCSNLRHTLNDNLKKLGGHIGYGVRPSARKKGYASVMLEKTLIKAKGRGVNEVLITCGKENSGSIGVIKKNGGVLKEEEYMESINEIVLRFIISL